LSESASDYEETMRIVKVTQTYLFGEVYFRQLARELGYVWDWYADTPAMASITYISPGEPSIRRGNGLPERWPWMGCPQLLELFRGEMSLGGAASPHTARISTLSGSAAGTT
jgi:hypothetical protein